MIEAAEHGGQHRARLDAGRSHGRQHRLGPGAGRRAKGLSPDAGHSRQDEPGKSLSSQGPGGRRGDDPQRRRPRPSGLLSGPGRADRRAKRPARIYINQFNNPANPLAHETTTGPEIWTAVRAAGWTPWSAASARAARSPGLSRYFAAVAPHVEIVLADPVGSILAGYIQTGHRHGRLVAGRGHRRGFSAADRRPVARPHGLFDQRRRKPGHRPRAVANKKASWPARRPARWSPPRCAIAASRPSPNAW